MNAETKTQIAAAPSNPPLDLADSPLNNPRIRPTRGLSRLACLTAHQLDHINAWLDESVPYREIVQLCKSEWQVEIPKTTIQRYNKRTSALSLIKDLQNSREVAREISKYAATGDPSFSTNSLEVLEQQAFDLAVAYQRDHDADDLATMNQLWKMIHHARNTRVRERHAAVQEEKCKLRSRELDLKQQLISTPREGHVPPCPTSTSRDATVQTNAASADQLPSNQQTPSHRVSIPHQDSAPRTQHFTYNPMTSPFPPFSPVQNLQPNERALNPSKLPFERIPGPCPLPDEIVIRNRAYALKLLAGQVDPDTGEVLPDPLPSAPREGHVPPCPTSTSRDETPQTNAAPADQASSREGMPPKVTSPLPLFSPVQNITINHQPTEAPIQ